MESRTRLIDTELKIVTLALIGFMAAVAIYPVLSTNVVIEPFSEIGILGANGKLGDYPKSVTVGNKFNLFVYVGDHEGKSEYYRIQVKLCDEKDNITDTQPLTKDPIISWDLFLMDNQNITFPVTLSLNESGVNKRLVFELNIFEPSNNDFIFKSRAQLWLNVTKTS